jgi:hypothetical protein
VLAASDAAASASVSAAVAAAMWRGRRGAPIARPPRLNRNIPASRAQPTTTTRQGRAPAMAHSQDKGKGTDKDKGRQDKGKQAEHGHGHGAKAGQHGKQDHDRHGKHPGSTAGGSGSGGAGGSGGQVEKVNPIRVQKFLKGLDYPADKRSVIDHAEQQGADERIRGMLENLPEEEYQTPADVSQAIGKLE